MTANFSTETPRSKSSLWVGALFIILGIAAIVAPVFSTLVTETWISLMLITAGAATLIYDFQNRDQEGFLWRLLLGALYIATGIMLLIYPRTGILTLTLLLGSFLVTEGIFSLILAFRLRPQERWSWVLGDGIITLLLGGMIWFQWPFNAPWLLGTLVGASVLTSGVSRIVRSLGSGSTQEAIEQSNPSASA